MQWYESSPFSDIRFILMFAPACFGGALFGWDIGAIGGILGMKPFMK
jgi:hypothetical protein